jgi:hypothetical protein
MNRRVAPWVGLLTAAVFLPVCQNTWLFWDDIPGIYHNAHLQAWTFDNLRWMWTTSFLGPYQPLSWMTLALDWTLWKGSAAGFHLTNLLLHAASAALLFDILWKIGERLGFGGGRKMALGAAAGALFFALHPLRVESVAWITERRDVLSGLFFMLAWRDYVIAERATPWTYFFFVLATLSKATAIGLIWVLFLTDAVVLHRQALKEKIWMGIVAGIITCVGWLGMKQGGLFFRTYSLSERLGIFAYSALFYLQKLLWPRHLSPLYPLPLDLSVMNGLFLWRGMAVLGITLILFIWGRRNRLPWGIWLTYLLILAPVSGLGQNGRQIAADRYTYLASVPWALLISIIAMRLAGERGRWWLGPLIVCMVIVYSVQTERQIRYWRDDRTLWERVVALHPDDTTGWYNLGTYAMNTRQYDQALSYFQRAITIRSDDFDANYNAGVAAYSLNRFPSAADYYRRAHALRPESREAANNLALALARTGRWDEGLDILQGLLARDPQFAPARQNLPVFLAHSHRH